MRRTGRFAPLRASLLLAAVFIAIRVGYRLVFGHASITSLGDAIVAAMPWAAIIVAFGVLSSLLDARKLLVHASRLPIGRSFATALSIAVATVPALAESAARVRQAQLLRGSRRRTAVLVPLLEHTVERAIALAAALELRGFGGRVVAPAEQGGVRWDNVTVRYGEREVLNAVSMECAPGTLTVLTGPTGGGKSTLLETVTGLTQHFHGATVTGSINIAGVSRTLAPRDTAGLVGYVPQQVRMGWVASTVGEELAFTQRLLASGPRLRSGTEITQLRSPSGVGATHVVEGSAPEISVPLEQSVDTLSAGQAAKLAITEALIGAPRVLVLDEPFADLDQTSRLELVDMLGELAAAGTTVLVAEHHTAELEPLNPRWLSVEDGRVTEGRWRAPTPSHTRVPAVVGTDVTVTIENPQMVFQGKSLPLDLHAELRAGSLVALTGPNGAGKTSLLRALTQPAPSTVRVRGCDAAAKQPQPALIAFVPEDVRDLFVRETLAEELAWADRVANCAPGLTELSLRSIIGSTDIDALMHTHPRDLSAGSQRALATAIQLSFKPGLLLIDEPTRGLDPSARAEMAETLRCVAETGCVVLFATHDLGWANDLTGEAWQMTDGKISVSAVAVSHD